MTNFLIYLLVFFLNIFVESLVVFLIEGKRIRLFQMIVLVNLITHPILCFFLWNNANFGFLELSDVLIIFLELLVVLIESFLLFFAFRKNYFYWLFLSFLMNLSSFLMGKIIF